MGDVGDIKIWDDADDPLLLLNFDLLFRYLRYFRAGKMDLDIRDIPGNGQGDLRDGVDLSRKQGSRKGLRGKAWRGDGELKSAGSDVGEREFAIAAGHCCLDRR